MEEEEEEGEVEAEDAVEVAELVAVQAPQAYEHLSFEHHSLQLRKWRCDVDLHNGNISYQNCKSSLGDHPLGR